MTRKFLFILIAAIVCLVPIPSFAQGPTNSTSTKMIYHGGSVVTDTPQVYLIWYGCWSADCGNPGGNAAQSILTEFVSSLGSTPYFRINSTYTDGNGGAPNGNLLYVGSESDPLYRFGRELIDADIQDIVRDRISDGHIPLNPYGIYVVIGAPDVGSTATGLCGAVGTPPWHGSDEFFGIRFRYGFVGDPARCPNIEAPQFISSDGTLRATPNGNLTADAVAAKLAHVLNTIVTDPYGDGWYDKFGLENADKCQGTFGESYTTPNGARANIRLGQRDFLLAQNWVNDRRGNRCALTQQL